MNIDIICPLYHAEKYIENLHNSFLKQKKVDINKIYYILTESNDDTEDFLIKNNCNYEKISKTEFSHSLSREKTAFNSKADIIVFVTQDVIIERDDWLYYLTKDINDEVVATYSRQLPKYNNIEKYTREYNYPSTSRIVDKSDLNKLGLNTFFFSDAASAIKRKIFVELNGYDNKDLPTNEDMYLAHKIIMAGYKIKYCADSEVIHSHNFKLSELYKRYKLTGTFFKENMYLNNYGTTKSGGNMAKYVLKRSIKDKNVKVIIRYPFDMATRLFGMKVGKK